MKTKFYGSQKEQNRKEKCKTTKPEGEKRSPDEKAVENNDCQEANYLEDHFLILKNEEFSEKMGFSSFISESFCHEKSALIGFIQKFVRKKAPNVRKSRLETAEARVELQYPAELA